MKEEMQKQFDEWYKKEEAKFPNDFSEFTKIALHSFSNLAFFEGFFQGAIKSAEKLK